MKAKADEQRQKMTMELYERKGEEEGCQGKSHLIWKICAARRYKKRSREEN
jgi:hypothetical protein